VKRRPTERREAAGRELVAILRAAYSGERAAALAYRGHWRASRDHAERAHIRQIEEDEWRHRRVVGAMLAALGERPSRLRELRSLVVGRTLEALCPLAGWMLPMYAAGRLEVSNVCAYDEAATLAAGCGREGLVPGLVEMAEVEREHERYFRSKVVRHPMGRVLRPWPVWPSGRSPRCR